MVRTGGWSRILVQSVFYEPKLGFLQFPTFHTPGTVSDNTCLYTTLETGQLCIVTVSVIFITDGIVIVCCDDDVIQAWCQQTHCCVCCLHLDISVDTLLLHITAMGKLFTHAVHNV